MRLNVLVYVVLGYGVVAACGGKDFDSQGLGGDAGSSGSAEGIPIEELPAEYGKAVCQAFTSCVGDLWSFFRPGEDCVKEFTITAEEELATLPDAIAAGRVKYHADKVQRCLDDLASRTCEAFSQRESASCQAAVEGTVAEGEACKLDAECRGDQYCKHGAACPGVCVPYEAAGGACTSNDQCKSGLKCGDNGRCVAPAKSHQACQQGEPDCAEGLLCLGEDAGKRLPGKCYPIAEALSAQQGEPCSLDSALCVAGSSCEITSVAPLGGTCAAQVEADAPCRAAFPDECPDDQYCQLDPNPLNGGTCTAKPKAGEACAKGVGADANICAPYARCDDGVCRELANAGEACNADDTCYSGHCVDGACVTANRCD